MQYFLSEEELKRFSNGLKTAIAVPFIDDIEDYIVEAILEYTKNIDGIDPFFNTRSKKLYDVVDNRTHIGWSVKSIQNNFHDNCDFELVIQRADVFKKAKELGFNELNINSDPNIIGSAILTHWNNKVDDDARAQCVTSKRVFILLKKENAEHIHTYAAFEEDIKQYVENELYWEWTSQQKNGLKGYRHSDKKCVYRWYPSQKQLFECFSLPANTQTVEINPVRLQKAQLVDILLRYIQEHQ